MSKAVFKDFKQFGKMPSAVRRDVITKDASWAGMSLEDQENFEKQGFVECLVAHKKGTGKQVISELTSRGIDMKDIRPAGPNQIVIRGSQATMQHIVGALYVNVPDLIVAPKNPYLTNSDNMGDVKLSPKGVPFSTVLNTTVGLVDESLRGSGRAVSPEGFAEFVYNKRLGMLTSGTADLRETNVLKVIECNIEDKLSQEQLQQKLGKLAKSDVMTKTTLKAGGVQR